MAPLYARLLQVKPRYLYYALALFVLHLVILLGAGVLMYGQLVERTEQQTLRTLNEIADVQSKAVATWIDERVSDATALSEGNALAENVNRWLATGAPAGAGRDSLFRQLENIRGAYGYSEVAIVDPAGKPYLSSDTQDGATAERSLPVAPRTLRNALEAGRPIVSTLHPGGIGEERKPLLQIAAPLAEPDSAGVGAQPVLIMRGDAAQHLGAFLARLPLEDTHTDALLAEIADGRVVPITGTANAAPFTALATLPLDANALVSSANQGSGLSLTESGDVVEEGARPSLGVARPVPGTPWFLITLIDPAAARADIENLGWLIALIAGGALALSGTALFFWARERESRYRLHSFRTATEKALLQRHYDYLSRYANDMIILTDRGGRMLEINDKTLHLLGRERKDVLGQSIDILFLPEYQPIVRDALNALHAQGNVRFEAAQLGARGALHTFEASARALERGGQYVAQFIFRDVSERLASEAALRESQERLDRILGSIRDIVWSFSPDLSRLNYINHSAEELLGYTVQEIERDPRLWLDCIHPEDRGEYLRALDRVTPRHPLFDVENRVVGREGTVRWLHSRGRLETDETGAPLRIDGVSSDITERKKAEQQIQTLAYYDGVTSLPNRTLLLDRLGKALPMAARTGRKVVLLFMDLDNFKNINDALGHPVGDQLLRAVAVRLLQCVREEDTVARIGGDEFLVVLPDLDHSAQAVGVAEKILLAIGDAFEVAEHRIHTTVSIGISTYPDDASAAQELIQHADSALYRAKAQGRNTFQFFTAELNDQITRSSDIERRLRQAIESGTLRLWYQPQCEAATGRLTGAEALTRWRLEDGNFLSPAEFIPVAEERGLISRIGEWALREACAQCRRWKEDGLQPVRVAVNVSPIQFQQKNFPELVTGILQESGIEGRLLELEITESALMHSASQVARLTRPLREAGVGISIDDFGTGYSSLNYLRQLPIDKIKIDRSFISDLPRDGAIARAIVELAHSLRLRVIAEGVESQAQIDRLRAFGCDEIQGHYFSRAVPPDAFGSLLAHRERPLRRPLPA